MYACIRETGRGFFEVVCALITPARESHDPPPPATQENRSPIARTPAQSGSLAALPWRTL